jgi:hypothetical protein
MRLRLGILIVVLLAVASAAQGPARLTTLGGLRQFPSYFHLQTVVVRGTVARTESRVSLRTETHEVRLLLPAGAVAPEGAAEARGTFLDVGKLEAGDPRLTGYERTDAGAWPRPGEELLLRVDRIGEPPTRPVLNLRTLALEPWTLEGQTVTVVGQFRGRNLFGDQPGTPKVSTSDFVLKNGDASVWVTGLRPKGKGFDLNVEARVDSRYWLEVTGTVRVLGGLVRLEGTKLAETTQPDVLSTEREAPAPPPPSPPVEVVFSDPTAGETDVALTARLRVQFSRNIDQATLTDQVRIAYAGDTGLKVPDWKVRYDAGAHAIEISFARPLDADMPVKVELLGGIRGFDKVPLVPWTLTFRTAQERRLHRPSRPPGAAESRRARAR